MKSKTKLVLLFISLILNVISTIYAANSFMKIKSGINIKNQRYINFFSKILLRITYNIFQ
jgi:hypothetical protein